MTPDQYCEDRAARAGSSFYYAFRFLPEERRRAITAFYAFCREADDIVDEVRDPTVAAAKLDYWRREVRAMAQGNASHPVALAMTPHLARFDIPIDAFEHVLDGMAQDLGKTRYLDFAELDRYCYLVAGVVGETSARIFGIPPGHADRTLAYARALGESLQLINILRDVGEDARRGRLYLPQSLLDEHRVSAAGVLRLEGGDALRDALAALYQRACSRYDEALGLLPAEARRAQRAGLAMGAIYRALAEEIRADGFRVLTHRVALTPIRKLWIAWKTVTFASR